MNLFDVESASSLIVLGRVIKLVIFITYRYFHFGLLILCLLYPIDQFIWIKFVLRVRNCYFAKIDSRVDVGQSRVVQTMNFGFL